MKQDKSIIYVNFSPYENAGRILDFLIENFSLVVLFSFDFHKLKNYRSNRIIIFRDRKNVKEINLFKLPTPEIILFITLPFIAFFIALQTIWYVMQFKRTYGKFNIYLTVNAFTAWIGNFLRSLKVVDKTIFWVWDYYPPGYQDWIIRFARWAYWRFDKWSTNSTNKIVFLNKKLIELRRYINIVPQNKSFKIVPIGTNPRELVFNKKMIIGHLGVLKQGQGFDLLIDSIPLLKKNKLNFQVEVVGSGPDEVYFKRRCRKYKNIKFYGFVENVNTVDNIIHRWSIGLATYIPNKSNESAWTDPSKIKAYLSQGVPVITTPVTDFSKEITKYNAGTVIDYYNKEEFINTVVNIFNNQEYFKKNALRLAQRYYYRKIYKSIFN